MKKKELQDIKPFIFTKKINSKYKTIPLKKITNIFGPTRYFLPTTREWFNSIYTFNRNSIKNLSIADKNLINLIRSYFNLFFNENVLKSEGLATRFRRLSINKIFFSKAELKHTNDKVIITLYIYNEERRVLINRIRRLDSILFPFFNVFGFTQDNENIKGDKFLSIKEKLNIVKYYDNFSLIHWLNELNSLIVQQIVLEEKQNDTILLKNTKTLNEKKLFVEHLRKYSSRLQYIINVCENDSMLNERYENFYKNFHNKTYLEKEINTIAYYKLLLDLNKYKFENKFISVLRLLVSKFYKKEVEFNFINLKTLYFNSDIFTEAISLKLKNRNNGLLPVLGSSLSMVKLPRVNKIKEQYYNINIKKLWINRINSLNIDFFKNKNRTINKDILNEILFDLFHSYSYSFNLDVKDNKTNIDKNLLNFVLNKLKYKNIGGVRLEAKGRLTRRFTASRSVFKIKWKGSLKNIDSSYRGLSSTMLRGYVKSNIQYSLINSKTRNGAFGLKGWISSK